MMIYWILLGILTLFIVLVILRKQVKHKICAICGAVSLTWITLLILTYLGFAIDPLIIGILMGESVTGIMYLFERKIKSKNKSHLLGLKIFIILLGTALVYFLLTYGLHLVTLVTFGLIILFILLVHSAVHNKFKHDFHGKGISQKIKKLEEQFEHCCD